MASIDMVNIDPIDEESGGTTSIQPDNTTLLPPIVRRRLHRTNTVHDHSIQNIYFSKKTSNTANRSSSIRILPCSTTWLFNMISTPILCLLRPFILLYTILVEPILNQIFEFFNIFIYLARLFVMLITFHCGSLQESMFYNVTLAGFLLAVVYGILFVLRADNFKITLLTKSIYGPEYLLLAARATGKWFTVCIFTAYITSLRSITSELSRVNASCISKLGVGWRSVHKALMKQALYAGFLHGAIHETRKALYDVAPLNPLWMVTRVTGYFLMLLFASQAIQGYITVLEKPVLNEKGRHYTSKMILWLKVWFRWTHSRTVHYLFAVVLFVHSLNVWMLVAVFIWWFDYWLHVVEVKHIKVGHTHDGYISVIFKPRRIADFPPEFGNYVQFTYKTCTASYTAVTLTRRKEVEIKMDKNCVIARMLCNDQFASNPDPDIHPEIDISSMRYFKIHGPYRSNPSLVNIANPLIIFTSGSGISVAKSAIEYYSTVKNKRVVVVNMCGNSRYQKEIVDRKLPCKEIVDGAKSMNLATYFHDRIYAESNYIDVSKPTHERSDSSDDTVEPLAHSYEEPNITEYNLYGRLDADDVAHLFQTLLLERSKHGQDRRASTNKKHVVDYENSYILLCGRSIVDLFLNQHKKKITTAAWEARVLVEDFN